MTQAYVIVLFLWFVSFSLAGHGSHHDEDFQPDYTLHVTEEVATIACEQRKSILVNGTSPGPEIRLKPYTTTWIRVYNDMDHLNTTMHWHGLAQRAAPFSDGSPLASQWPIPPKHFFDYQIYAEPDDAGTYFYHSHVGMQAVSAAGALIVEDCGPPPYDYDDEKTIILTDFFNRTDEDIELGLVNVPFKWSGETNAVLLNGVGISENVNTSEHSCPLPVIDVCPGKTYRLRFIGATALSHTLLAIEEHSNLTIINVEGHYTQPHNVDRMQLGSGNRFDVLLKTKSPEELLASGARQTFAIQFETRERPRTFRGFGMLRYDQAATIPSVPHPPPITLPNNTFDWTEYSLEPLHPREDFPQLHQVTRRIVLNTTQIQQYSQQVIWQFNNLTWNEDTYHTPLLVDIYKRGQIAIPSYNAAVDHGAQGYDPKVRAFPAKRGEVIEIVFQNTGSLYNYGGGVDVHPFHAHGQHVYDIGSGNGTYDPIANEAKIKSLGWKPIERDTTMLYRYGEKTTAGAAAGWRAWRIRMEQPGVWMVHCHTIQHMIMGMQTVWVVGDAEDIIDVPIEFSQGYLDYGGSSYGNETFSPIVWEQGDSPGYCAANP